MPGNNNNNGQGNPMNGGYNGGNNPTDILSTITQTLTQSLGSVERQLQNISTQLINLNGQTTQANRNSQNFIRNFMGNRRSRGMAYQERTLNNLYSELKKLRNDTKVSTIGNGSGKGIDGAIASGFNKIQKKYQESLNKIQQNLQTESNIQQLQQRVNSAARVLENKRQQRTQAEQSGNTAEVRRLDSLIQTIETRLTQRQQNLDSQMATYTQQMEDAYEENSRAVQALQQSYEALNEVNSKLSGAYSDLSSISPAFANFIENQDKLSKKDQYKEAVNKAIEVVTESITQLEEKIASLSDEDSEQKEILEKQLKNAQEQEKYLKNLKPIKDNLRTVGNSLKNAGLNLLKGAVTGLKNSLENRYLDTYAEGFQRVYDSVESTRNEISARLRFNQGQFDDMQNNIQAEIKAQGLEGAISLVDVNEAVQGLVAAGITDQETIEKLAFEQAKLKYMGSDINLSNEETLSGILTYMNREGVSIDQVTETLDNLASQIRYQGTVYGNTMAMANGGADAMINQVLSLGLTSGRTWEQLGEDFSDAVASRFSLRSYGISEDMFLQMAQEIQKGNVTANSPYYNYLTQLGLSPAEMLEGNLDLDEIQQKLLNSTINAIGAAQGNMMYLSPLMDVWGISGDVDDYKRLIDAVNSEKGIKTSMSLDDKKNAKVLAEADRQAMKDAIYKSQTEKVNTEYENKMTDFAQNAEHFFEGDTIFMSQINNIKNGIDSIIDILATFAWSSITGGSRGLFGGKGVGGVGGGVLGDVWTYLNLSPSDAKLVGGTGNTAADFMIGAKGTTAGKLGTAAGIAYGAYDFGSAVMSNLQRNEDGSINIGKTALETFSDEQAIEGIMEGVGSALAGPLGAAVGKGSVKIGTYIRKSLGICMDTSTAYRTSMEKLSDKFKETSNAQLEAAELKLEASNTQLEAAKSKEANKGSMADAILDYYSKKDVHDPNYNKYTIEDLDKMDTSQITGIYERTIIEPLEDAIEKLQLNKLGPEISASMSDVFAELQAEKTLSEKGGKGTVFDLSEDELRKTDSTGVSSAERGLMENESDVTQIFKGLYDISEKYGSDYGKGVEAVNRASIGKGEMETGGNYTQELSSSEEASLKVFQAASESYLQRKQEYDKANEEFHKRWNKAKSLTPESFRSSPEMVRRQYYQMDMDVYGESGKKLKDVTNMLSDNIWTLYGTPEEPNLPYGTNHEFYTSAYMGKFKSGLTRVPSNNYTAVLHE